MIRIPAVLMMILAIISCTEVVQSPIEVATAERFASESRAGSGELVVLTWNVYYGADLSPLMVESDVPLPVTVAQVFGQVMATDAPARATAIARQIADARPHLVGFQEVAHFRMQSPGDVLLGNFEPNASDDVFDFLALVQAALADLSVDYVVAARTSTFDVELPILNSEFRCDAESPCDDLRFTESVAVLARADLEIANPHGGTYAINLPVEVAGMTIEVVKGWASVDATLKQRTYRFVTTHLEPADFGDVIVPEVHQIQLAQASELLSILDGVDHPIILTGDLNTEPGGASTDTYVMLAETGFADTWLVGRPRGPGYSAIQDADLLNAESKLSRRIDYVLYRDSFTMRGVPFRGAVRAELVGEQQADRTPGGLWPSDHAGVLTALQTPQAPTR